MTLADDYLNTGDPALLERLVNAIASVTDWSTEAIEVRRITVYRGGPQPGYLRVCGEEPGLSFVFRRGRWCCTLPTCYKEADTFGAVWRAIQEVPT